MLVEASQGRRTNTHLQAKQLKGRIHESYPDRETTPPSPNPSQWEKLLTLVQHMWEHRTISTELSWNILVLIPGGNADTQVVGLLEVLWKVVEAVIDTCNMS